MGDFLGCMGHVSFDLEQSLYPFLIGRVCDGVMQGDLGISLPCFGDSSICISSLACAL